MTTNSRPYASDDGSDNGNYDDGAIDTSTDNLVQDDGDHKTVNDTDSGTFTGGSGSVGNGLSAVPTGSYSDGQTKDDTTIDDESGIQITGSGGTTTTGNYDDETHDLDGDDSSASESTAGTTSSGSHTDYSKVDDVDSGTFDDSAAGNDSTGTFNDSQTNLTTDTGSQSSTVGAFSSSQYGADATLSQGGANGGETDDSGVVTDTGDDTGHVVATDDGGSSSNYSVSGPGYSESENHSSTFNDTDIGNAGGPFTEINGAITQSDSTYNDNDVSQATRHDGKSSSEALDPGNSFSVSGSSGSDGSQKGTHVDAGQDDLSPLPPGGGQGGGETNDGTATDTEHDTSSATQNVSGSSPGSRWSVADASGDVDDQFVSGNYEITSGGQTDHDTFDLEDRPSGSTNNQTSNITPGDAGTNSSTSDTSSWSADDADDGSLDKSGVQVTSETDNFSDSGQSHDTSTANAASDRGPVAGLVPAVPLLAGTDKTMTTNGPTFAGLYSVPGYLGPQTASGKFSSQTDDDEKDHEEGTTTDENGVVDTDEVFGETDNSDWNSGQTTTSGGSSAAGGVSDVVTASDNGTETGTDGGTIDGGVTTDGYDDDAHDTTKSTETFSFNATSSLPGGLAGTNGGTYKAINVMTTTTGVNGDDTTPPAGSSDPTGPNGDATSDQTIDASANVTNDFTLTRDASVSGGAISDVSHYDTTSHAKGTFNTDGTVTSNAAAGTSSQSGDYGRDIWQNNVTNTSGSSSTANGSGGNSYHGTGSTTDDDTGHYGGTDTDTDSGSASSTLTWWQDVAPFGGTTIYTPTPSTFTTTEPARDAPTVDAGGGAPAAHGAVVLVVVQPLVAEGGDGIAFVDGKGPVRIIGIVGNGEVAGKKGTGVATIVNGVAKSVGEQEHRKPSTEIYGSSGGEGALDQDGNNNKSVDDIVNEQMKLIRNGQGTLKDGETFRVAIIGYSYGADKAIQVAAKLRDKINSEGLNAQIHLRTIDAINPMSPAPPGRDTGADATTQGPGPAPGIASNWNFFQKGDTGFFVDANGKRIPLNGEALDGAHNENVTAEVNEKQQEPTLRHASIGDIIAQQVIDSLMPSVP